MSDMLWPVIVIGAILFIAFVVREFSYKRAIEKHEDKIRAEERENAQREKEVEIQRWKAEYEKSTRNDAIQKSKSAIMGSVTEHLAPLLPGFPYKPKDVQWVGGVCDYLIIDGLSEEKLPFIILADIKTGPSAHLDKRQRLVKAAVDAGRVRFEEIRIDYQLEIPSAVDRDFGAGPKHQENTKSKPSCHSERMRNQA